MIGALRTPQDGRWYRLALGGLILGAWGALVLWGASPYAALLDHAANEAGGPPLGVRLPAFVIGWTLMTVAMMLPSSLPLVHLFRRMLIDRPDAGGLLARLLVGYLAVWALFGVAAYLGDVILHLGIAAAPGAAWLVAPAVVMVAGAYQFTSLKQACLEQCRSPYSFLVAHWRGRRAGWDAFRLGVRHGLFCLGCCWTLMLVLFAVGGMNLGWMLGLGALMAAERATTWGRGLSRPLGFVLIAWAALRLVGAAGGVLPG
jgi:predicted metal-binding membrane protein